MFRYFLVRMNNFHIERQEKKETRNEDHKLREHTPIQGTGLRAKTGRHGEACPESQTSEAGAGRLSLRPA